MNSEKVCPKCGVSVCQCSIPKAHVDDLRRQLDQRDAKLARIASACGLPDPYLACRVILKIVKEIA